MISSDGSWIRNGFADRLAAPATLGGPLYMALYTDSPVPPLEEEDRGLWPAYWIRERGPTPSLYIEDEIDLLDPWVPEPNQPSSVSTPYTVDLSGMPLVGPGDTFTIQWNPYGVMDFTIDHVAVWDANAADPMCDHDTCWENLG